VVTTSAPLGAHVFANPALLHQQGFWSKDMNRMGMSSPCTSRHNMFKRKRLASIVPMRSLAAAKGTFMCVVTSRIEMLYCWRQR